jgi:hypothetical protein
MAGTRFALKGGSPESKLTLLSASWRLSNKNSELTALPVNARTERKKNQPGEFFQNFLVNTGKREKMESLADRKARKNKLNST